VMQSKVKSDSCVEDRLQKCIPAALAKVHLTISKSAVPYHFILMFLDCHEDGFGS
jgi:hypothetical protein